MKALLIILLLAGPATIPCRAQSTADAIQQLLLDFQKLQEMKAILQRMYKSYEILDKGYTEIRNLAQGRYDLHKVFLDGLLAISPAVKDYYRIKAIVDAEYNLVKEYKAGSARAHGSGVLTSRELDYVDGIFSTVFNRSLQSIDELTMVLTAQRLRMDDAQRLRAIDRLYAEINGQLMAVRDLNNETALQVLQRKRAANDLETLKKLYDIP